MLRTCLAFASLLLSSPSFATTVLPVPLERMAQNADIIFYGRVLGNEVKLDPVSQRVATFTRFAVLDAVKGIDSSTYTMKQVGGQLPGSPLVNRVYGVPRFKLNEEYVVFLPQASRLGFASPIGLSQGSYSIRTDANGKTVRGGAATSTAKSRQDAPASDNTTSLDDFLHNVRVMIGR